MSASSVGAGPAAVVTSPNIPDSIGVEDGCWNCQHWSRVQSAIGRCYSKRSTGFTQCPVGTLTSFIYRCGAHAKIGGQTEMRL